MKGEHIPAGSFSAQSVQIFVLFLMNKVTGIDQCVSLKHSN